MTLEEITQLKEETNMIIEQKEAVIFDLDGTMTDSMWIWEEMIRIFSGNRAFPCRNISMKKIEE